MAPHNLRAIAGTRHLPTPEASLKDILFIRLPTCSPGTIGVWRHPETGFKHSAHDRAGQPPQGIVVTELPHGRP